jgi:hypothetical protein
VYRQNDLLLTAQSYRYHICLHGLTENYQMKYCKSYSVVRKTVPSSGWANTKLFFFRLHFNFEDMYHLLTWPQLSFVGVDERGRVVGYILAKM